MEKQKYSFMHSKTQGCMKVLLGSFIHKSDQAIRWIIHGLFPSSGKRIFCPPLCPDWVWGPPNLMFDRYQGFFSCSWSGQCLNVELPLFPVHAFWCGHRQSRLLLDGGKLSVSCPIYFIPSGKWVLSTYGQAGWVGSTADVGTMEKINIYSPCQESKHVSLVTKP